MNKKVHWLVSVSDEHLPDLSRWVKLKGEIIREEFLLFIFSDEYEGNTEGTVDFLDELTSLNSLEQLHSRLLRKHGLNTMQCDWLSKLTLEEVQSLSSNDPIDQELLKVKKNHLLKLAKELSKKIEGFSEWTGSAEDADLYIFKLFLGELAELRMLEGFRVIIENIDGYIRCVRNASDSESATATLSELFPGLSPYQIGASLEHSFSELINFERETLEFEIEHCDSRVQSYLDHLLG